jgi:acetolactate synthase-1/2/3 large subunit
MTPDHALRSGGEIVVRALLAHAIDRVFTVPGESFLPLLDALYDEHDRVQVVTCRHEHGAAMMAEAHGKLTGRPALAVVTRGPGAANAAIGVHTAFQDSTPMLLLVGQVQRALQGREAFQEVDLVRFFAPLAKHVEQVERADALPAALTRALGLAKQGRMGPSVVVVPADVMAERVAVADLPPAPVPPLSPKADALNALADALAAAERPVMLLGGSGWTETARDDIRAFAATHTLPVACGFRRHDLFPADDPLFIGELGLGANPALVQRVREADLLLAVGSRLGEATTQGYTLPRRGTPALIHIHPSGPELGRVFPTMLAIHADVASFAAAARRLAPTGTERRRGWVEAARADFIADRTPKPSKARLDLAAVMVSLDAALANDAIVTVDAGNFSGWPQRYLRFGGGRRLLGPTNGAMGYGVPAAIAAKLAAPHRPVIACIGDGGFGMTGQELATAVQYGAAIVVLVFNNGMYGTIRMHQEKNFPGRAFATQLTNPDFAALARAYGGFGETVAETAAFPAALARALGAGRPALIELRCDPEQISTRTTLSALGQGASGIVPPPAVD